MRGGFISRARGGSILPPPPPTESALNCEHDPLLALDSLQTELVTGPALGPECPLSDANGATGQPKSGRGDAVLLLIKTFGS